ncbi:helix-turn-helix domain-containing protein [Allonocardiopsis opalescens]|uniref:Helix-turn-helix protein n=1 Tax=Allonocardiopsis opalescens TaxID=1144618 RepID=A0A2T0PVQ4_9ACTN|nr:helix-turn-helix transcriptional regulator [Allonocardiopsis opalescens]PRX95613.1 helix-turn-helix protein [Allonocardiopsis opalescens]
MSPPRFNGQAARRRRLELGLSVEEVAGRIGKSPYSVYKHERENVRPQPHALRELLEIYGMEIGDLVPEYADARYGRS